MSCNRAATILHGYFNNELDDLGAAEFERHLEQCSVCISALEALESLRSLMNIAQLSLAAEIVDAHLRSLQPEHLNDVVSTDQHTVKPWFDGKLDFSPPVQDFTDQGFSLQGGRIDVVHGRSVAALVYACRKHFVSVFVWPTDEKDAAPRSDSQHRYQWIDWSKEGMEFCAVSDAAPSALEQLQRLFTE